MFYQYCGRNIYCDETGRYVVSDSNLTFPSVDDAVAFIDGE